MAKKTILERRIQFRQSALEKLYAAYEALLDGGVKSYKIDDRELTRIDLPDLADEIRRLENEIDEMSAELNGQKKRKSVAVIPRDW